MNWLRYLLDFVMTLAVGVGLGCALGVSTPQVLLYDAELRHRATLGARGEARQVGDRLRYPGRGEYAVFRVEAGDSQIRYRAVASHGWG